MFPDVQNYSAETQLAAREELKALGCLPADDKASTYVRVCKAPTLYAWVVDYHKMREQTRAAIAASKKSYPVK